MGCIQLSILEQNYTPLKVVQRSEAPSLKVVHRSGNLKLKSGTVGYVFGFNGMEKDDEVRGEGNAIEFGGRSIYDPRLGKFMSIDPWTAKYAWQSPYAYYANSPVWQADYKGLGGSDGGLGMIMAMEQAEKYGHDPMVGVQTYLDQEKTNAKTWAIATGVGVGGGVVYTYGLKATGLFLLNEAKDEALSLATNGYYDFIDLTKVAKNSVQAGYKWLKRKLSIGDGTSIIKGANGFAQENIDIASEYLKDNLGKDNTEINIMLQTGIDVTKEVKETTLEKGGLLYRWEAKVEPNMEKHFFTNRETAIGGAQEVGLIKQGYELKAYELLDDVNALESFIKGTDGKSIQYTFDGNNSPIKEVPVPNY